MSIATPTRAVHSGHAMADGTAARELSAAPLPDTKAKPRTPLSLVPASTRSRRAGFAVFCFALLLAALVGVLVINVNVASSQYDIVGLHSDEQALKQENEALTQELQNLQAPQNVAAKAAELGMVTPGAVASINLDTQKITGKATAAEKGKLPTSLVAAPEVPGDHAPSKGADERAVTDGQSAATEPAGVPAGSGTTVDQMKPTENTQETSTQDLNGGTIPAPAQQNAGQ